MKHASSNHQLHGQRHTPHCITSVLCSFTKSAQNQPICWALWSLKGMHPDIQLMPQACQSVGTLSQAKWTVPAAVNSTMDRGTTLDVSFLSCAFLPNLSKTSPSAGRCLGLKTMHHVMQAVPISCGSIYMHPKGTWNVSAPIISSMDRGAHHNVSFLSCAFCQIYPKPASLLGAMGPERNAF